MSPLSRLLVIETGYALQQNGLLALGERFCDIGKTVGLIGGTKRGSLHTDQAFIGTMADGPGAASPALFGYTLPNIPLAEAAGVFGLVGPVYAVFDKDNPLKSAEDEARRLLVMQKQEQEQKNLNLMLACEFDHYRDEQEQEKLSVTLTVVEHNANSNPGLSKVE